MEDKGTKFSKLNKIKAGMAMFKVGNKDVLLTQSFIVADGELVMFDFIYKPGHSLLPDFPLTIKLSFLEPDNPTTQGSWTFENNEINLIFKGWGAGGGISYAEPPSLGTLLGRPLSYNIASFKIERVNVATFQLFLG